MPDLPDTAPSARSRSVRTFQWLNWTGLEQYIRTRFLWGRVYRTMSYVRSSLWLTPLLSVVAVLMVSPAVLVLDRRLDWRVFGLTADGAQALYGTVITLTLSFVVFTFGSLLVAIQVAGVQLTPRIIATTLLRDNVVRSSVGLFVFTLVFAVMALNRQANKVNDLASLLTAVLGIACLAVFLFLIDYAARLLRPVSILTRVGEAGLAVIESVYPNPVSPTAEDHHDWASRTGSPQRLVEHGGRSEIVVAIDLHMLVVAARQSRGTIEFIPRVGDFVAKGEPLFALYGGAASLDDRKLSAAVAFGPERTLEQDPIFALRIVVDIALKALSAAINDPTTAVLALDQVHRLLRATGRRELAGDAILDALGEPRVICRTPNWEDFVNVACNEIRSCGAKNVQVARRMRAMFDNLCDLLPAHRQTVLREERDRLDSMLADRYPIPADLELARQPDSQGLGGSSSPYSRVQAQSLGIPSSD